MVPRCFIENVCEKTSCRGMGILPMCRKSFIVFKPSFSHGRDASETHGQDARATFHTRSERKIVLAES